MLTATLRLSLPNNRRNSVIIKVTPCKILTLTMLRGKGTIVSYGNQIFALRQQVDTDLVADAEVDVDVWKLGHIEPCGPRRQLFGPSRLVTDIISTTIPAWEISSYLCPVLFKVQIVDDPGEDGTAEFTLQLIEALVTAIRTGDASLLPTLKTCYQHWLEGV
jgi:hypothetical protein